MLLRNIQPSWNDNAAIVMEKALMKFGMNKNDEASRLLAPVLTEGDQQWERYIYLSRGLLDMERYETSDDYFEKAMVIHASPYPYFNRGCAYAKIGQNDRAFVALNKAVELGINVRNEYENNIDLEKLKDDPRWKILMGKMGG
jgi:tetratricopeptide (TPR) repeat protein